MNYQKIKPSPSLQPYVRCYYILEHESGLGASFELDNSANPSYALVFNYGDRYQLFNSHIQGDFLPQSFLSGLSISKYTLRFQGKVGCCGVIFNGTAFRGLFDIPPLSEIIDRRVDLRLLLGTEAEEVGEQIGEANTSAERIAVLEKFLLDKLTHATHAPGRIDLGVNLIFQQRGMLSMDQLADELNLSPRQLRRSFKERVGVGPKTYARLKRFNYVKRCLSRNPCLSWKEFIDQGGFYDQSHFIKEFVRFSGEKPTHFTHRHQALQQQLLSEKMVD